MTDSLFIEKQNKEPLCRFGPGGEYTTTLDRDDLKALPGPAKLLDKLISSIATLAASILNAGFDTRTDNSKNYLPREDYDRQHQQKTPANAQTTAAIENRLGIHEQPVLFPIHNRTGKQPLNKQKHRVRAHHRPPAKRPSESLARQGTLFDTDKKIAISA